MAQRLATNYANANFMMNQHELDQFVELFARENIDVRVKICDNGDREIVIHDKSGEIALPFRREGCMFICESSYMITDLALANVMRKAMKTFRGHGIVHRIYDGFTVVYHYDEGSITRIEELSEDHEANIFEASNHNYAKELEYLFANTDAEQEIAHLRQETDRLLDMRNEYKILMPIKVSEIDHKLAVLSQRLFVLEA